MKVDSFSVELRSTHQFTSTLAVTERLEIWRDGAASASDGRGIARGPVDRADLPGQGGSGGVARGPVHISTAARAALAADAAPAETGAADDPVADPDTDDPRLSLLIRMVELLTGERVRRFDARVLQPRPDAAPAPSGGQGEQGAAGRAGFGIEYHYEARYEEHEAVRFAASGVVRTTDGAEIRFDVAFAMNRHYSESVSFGFRAGDVPLKDPLVLDFGGPASALSDLRFDFDLDGDGRTESLPLLGGSGFLAFDRNDNGRIDDGRELFGPRTGDGFAELAALDDDGNGWIDEADAAWSQLRLWQPDANGAGRLMTLAEAGVGALYLGRVDTPFSLRDAANDTLGQLRASSIYLREDGRVGTVSQVDLRV
jgi:hypothetical protein